jgi:hypothetical protein
MKERKAEKGYIVLKGRKLLLSPYKSLGVDILAYFMKKF